VSELSDLELIFLARQGDKAAFSQLVLRYQPMAQRIATKVVSNEDLAQELVQDAILQAYVSLAKLHDLNCFKSWLYGIVLNVCRSNLRSRKIICFSLETIDGDLAAEPLLIAGNLPNPEQVIEQREIETVLQEAIDTLSHKNRLATLLFYYEQLSLQEVADRLNISVGAVKGRLHKARHQLRKQLLSSPDQVQSTLFEEYKTMTTKTYSSTQPTLCCSFCYKSQKQVEILIAGPPLENGNIGIYICNSCVDICNKIIKRQIPPLSQEKSEKLMYPDKLSD
jgi:RNA polymerase sigma factor (sigma-70 family)